MPLKQRYSHSTFNVNVADMIAAGHAPGSALSDAYNNARRSFRKAFPTDPFPDWLMELRPARPSNNPVSDRGSLYCLTCATYQTHVDKRHHSGERLAQCLKCGTFKPHSVKFFIEQNKKQRVTAPKKNPVGKLPGITVREIIGLVAKRHVVSAYPRKGIIVVDGSKRYKASPATLAAVKRAYAKNPVPASRRVQLRNASKLFSDFTGHKAEVIDTVDKPVVPDVMSVIGDIDGILYTTVRDGQVEKYIHKFKKKCRPLFAVSHDGKQLFMLGGSYDFTELGIVDKT
jgi:hypothetical protein